MLDFTIAALESANIPPYVPPSPPPPPPFTIFINGTSLAQPGNTCSYQGGSTDAASPYALSWSLNGSVISTEPSVNITFSTPGVHELTLAILDAEGKAWMKHQTVDVSSANSPCLAQ